MRRDKERHCDVNVGVGKRIRRKIGLLKGWMGRVQGRDLKRGYEMMILKHVNCRCEKEFNLGFMYLDYEI